MYFYALICNLYIILVKCLLKYFPILKRQVVCFIVLILTGLCIFWIWENFPYQIHVLLILFHGLWLVSNLLMVSFRKKSLFFMKSSWLIFLIVCLLYQIFNPKSYICFLIFSRNFIVSYLTFRFMIHFEWAFVYGVRCESKIILFFIWLSKCFSTICWKECLFCFVLFLRSILFLI